MVFPYVRVSKKSPEETAKQIGEFLVKNKETIEGYNVVKGFLNLVVNKSLYFNYFNNVLSKGFEISKTGRTVMVEYSSPNTNKPLHLGHVRNNLLGYSVSNILKAAGNEVLKTNIVNDRGIHICKSMLAWQKWGNGETPQSSGIKGDHLVGKYYVEFDKHYKSQISLLKSQNLSEADAEKQAPLMLEAKEMLRKWEAGDKEVIDLWKTMNGWVYEGFAESYKKLGVDFDKIYYESDTYILGKSTVEEGLAKGVFKKRADNSVYIDLTQDGLDEKTLLRADGTSVYITQDIGTAIERFKEFPNLNQLIYTVGNEQDYHFKVLFLILKKLGYKWAEECYHLSYGMVELPEGKMKSREGTVVDADDLIDEMIQTAKETTEELGKIEGFTKEEAENLYRIIGMGALKYFMLKVDPKKKMLFNPKESIDFNGNTGPFIQYTHARICSVLKKASSLRAEGEAIPTNAEIASSLIGTRNDAAINPKEKELLKLIYDYTKTVKEAAKQYSPAVIANYTYEVAKAYNQFYHDTQILKEENENLRNFRLALSKQIANIIKSSMNLLGIEVPEKM